MVVSSFPLSKVIHSRDAAGKVAKWAMELMGREISYVSQTAIKSKVLSDFVAEWTETQLNPAPIDQEYWVMFFDGSLTRQGAGAGLVFVSPRGAKMRYAIRLHFPASNNVAEYEALVNGLKITIELGIKHLEVRGDSQLVVNQVMKESSCSSDAMAAYCTEVRKLEGKFDGLELRHVLRKFNDVADTLAKMASAREPVYNGTHRSCRRKKSFSKKKILR